MTSSANAVVVDDAGPGAGQFRNIGSARTALAIFPRQGTTRSAFPRKGDATIIMHKAGVATSLRQSSDAGGFAPSILSPFASLSPIV